MIISELRPIILDIVRVKNTYNLLSIGLAEFNSILTHPKSKSPIDNQINITPHKHVVLLTNEAMATASTTDEVIEKYNQTHQAIDNLCMSHYIGYRRSTTGEKWSIFFQKEDLYNASDRRGSIVSYFDLKGVSLDTLQTITSL